MMENKKIRKRISLIKNKNIKRKRSTFLSDSSSIEEERFVKSTEKKHLTSEVVNIYESYKTNEKIFLLKNEIDFSLIGRGTFRIIHGNVNIFGFSISHSTDSEDFEFDISEMFPLYSCYNKGVMVQNQSQYEDIIKKVNGFTGVANENVKNKIKLIKDFYFKLGEDKISILYFKEFSPDFEIMKKNEILTKNLEFIDFRLFESKNNKTNKRRIIICGKKNSGKSTFLTYKINSMLSDIKSHIKTVSSHDSHSYLFLLECDSGQPLISPPYNVSLIKINKPIFHNYYKEFDFQDGEELNYDNIINLFVEETTPSNNFDDYLNCIGKLSNIYNDIINNHTHFLIVNTNGYTSGLGNVINSAILDIIKPDLTFYVKNKKAGRSEKGEEFENLILNEEEKENLNIILRPFKVSKSNFKTKNLDLEPVLIENDFHLKADNNMKNKNINKNLYVYSNLLGKRFNLLKSSYSSLENIFDSKIIHIPVVNVSFDQILFSFNFNEFLPQTELDIYFAINSKMCFILNLEKDNLITSNLGNRSIIDNCDINLDNKNFISFAFIRNIDLINNKLCIVSDKLEKIFKKNPNFKFVLHRANSCLDKNIQISKESDLLDNLLNKTKFSEINYFNSEDKVISTNKIYYQTRNKYSII